MSADNRSGLIALAASVTRLDMPQPPRSLLAPRSATEIAPSEANTVRAPLVDQPVLINLSTVPPSAVTWLWRGYIPGGKLTVLDGDPGLGKSLLTLDLAARVSTGVAMPDGTKSAYAGPGGVILLSAEDDLGDTIRPRLDAARADCARIVALSAVLSVEGTERQPCLLDISALEQAIQSVTARLIVVDPIMAYLPSHTDSHRDQDVRALLSPLTKLASRTGCAIVIVRHLNKSGGSNPLYRGGGSIGIVGAVRSGLLVGKDPDDTTGARRVLALTKANLATDAGSLAYHVEPTDGVARIVWEGRTNHTAERLVADRRSDDDGGALTEAKAILVDLLAAGPVPAKDVQRQARDAGVSEKTLRRAKDALGVIAIKTGRPGSADQLWKCALPEGGQAATKMVKPESLAIFGESEAIQAVSPKVAKHTKVDHLRPDLGHLRAEVDL